MHTITIRAPVGAKNREWNHLVDTRYDHKNAQNNDGILLPKTDVNWFTDLQIGSIGLGTWVVSHKTPIYFVVNKENKTEIYNNIYFSLI